MLHLNRAGNLSLLCFLQQSKSGQEVVKVICRLQGKTMYHKVYETQSLAPLKSLMAHSIRSTATTAGFSTRASVLEIHRATNLAHLFSFCQTL